MQLEDIKGLGQSRIRKLKEAGINQPLDILLWFPYKYVDLNRRYDIAQLNTGDEFTVEGKIINEPKVQYLRKGLNIIKAELSTQYGIVEVAWFNRKFLVSSLSCGKIICVTGKIKKFRNKISVNAPVLIQPQERKVMSLYRNIPGLSQKILLEAIDTVLSKANIYGYIPESIRVKRGLPLLNEAFRQAHKPKSIEAAVMAVRALALEKLSYTLATMKLIKNNHDQSRKFVYTTGDDKLEEVIATLPFELTEEQRDALNEIIVSLHGEKNMNRLLQGDVGCGKTIIALLIMYYAFLNGYQSVLMAPTEILAIQHYKSAIKYLEKFGVKITLLCGSLTKNERDTALFNIRTHSADIIIGTHALIGDDVEFGKLALIITDEQQRFGVNQRGMLESKGIGADTVVMTATPIPRTLALCMYGELEQSFIKRLPEGRAEIVTLSVPKEKFGSMFEYVAECAAKGEQTYIVCSRIESDEEEELVSAIDMHLMLTKKFPQCEVGLLHGRMKDSEKSEIMKKFADGLLKILVATTVIEVGIDVPNATNIIIFNSERYGLSQLHQLRGRVGRGSLKSYCFLPISDCVSERLKFFCECNDGFKLAEYDFAQRGAGDFIGTRQHGENSDLPIKIDSNLITEAKSLCDDIFADECSCNRIRESISSGTEQYVRLIAMN